MTHQYHFPEQLPPTKVIVLSEESHRSCQELRQFVEEIFQGSDKSDLLPFILIVDDVNSTDPKHQSLLKELAEAGGILLVPETEELTAVRHDPRAYAAAQFALAATSIPDPATGFSSPVPSQPDGYKEFAKAFTNLAPEAVKDVIEDRRSDDWRFSS